MLRAHETLPRTQPCTCVHTHGRPRRARQCSRCSSAPRPPLISSAERRIPQRARPRATPAEGSLQRPPCAEPLPTPRPGAPGRYKARFPTSSEGEDSGGVVAVCLFPARPVSYQLFLEGGEGGLQPELLAVGAQGLLAFARRHSQGGSHQLPLLLPQHLELLEAGQGRLQPLAHPAAIPAARPRGAQQHPQRWAAAPAMAVGRRGGGGAGPASGRVCGQGRSHRSAAGGGASARRPRRLLRFWRRGGEGGGSEGGRRQGREEGCSAGATSRGGYVWREASACALPPPRAGRLLPARSYPCPGGSPRLGPLPAAGKGRASSLRPRERAADELGSAHPGRERAPG